MNPAFNTIEDGKKLIAEYWQSYPILSDIDEIKGFLAENSDTISPDTLSQKAFRLSVLLVNLGNLVAQITAQANESYMYRKFQYMWQYTSLSNDMRVKDRENEALNKSFDWHKQELINRFVADYLKEYKEDVERLVGAIQSRLRTLQGEKIAGYMDAKAEGKEY